MVLLDLKSFYLYLPLHPEVRRYFQIVDPETGERLKYCVVPFGLSSAPSYASLVSAELLSIILHRANLAESGERVRGSSHIDDFGLVSQDHGRALEAGDIAGRLLEEVGLPESREKRCGPTTRARWLGAVHDTETACSSASLDHLEAAAEEAWSLSRARRWSRRRLQSAVGLIQWVSQFVCGSQPYLRSAWDCLRGARRWFRPTKRARADFRWWSRTACKLAKSGGGVRWIGGESPLVLTWSDASGDVGWGIRSGSYMDSGRWGPDQAQKSVPYKELFPIHRFASRLGRHLSNGTWVVFTDSASVAHMLNNGRSAAEDCNDMLRDIASSSRDHNYEYVALWMPRECNEGADALSKNPIPGPSPAPSPHTLFWL